MQPLLDALQSSGSVLLTGPAAPDGDSIGACLALQRVLAARGVPVDVAGTPSFRYAWLPGADGMIADDALPPHYDAVAVLDGDRHRLSPPARDRFTAARVRGIIDHHASTQPDGYTDVWLDPDAGSTCEMLYEALEGWGEPLDTELATLLYAGVVFDTGGFRYTNARPQTHQMACALLAQGIDHATVCARVLMERSPSGLRLAAEVFQRSELHLDGTLAVGVVDRGTWARLGCSAGDLEGLVESLLYIVGVDVAVLVVERADDTVKYSLRSRGDVNVAHIAQQLTPSGGGHAKAAGACVEGGTARAVDRVIRTIDAARRADATPLPAAAR